MKPFPVGYCLADSNTFPHLIILGVGKLISVSIFAKGVELRKNPVVLIMFFQKKLSLKQSRAEMKGKFRKC